MNGDTTPSPGSDAEFGGPPLAVAQLLEHEIEAGARELDRPARGLFLSGLSAGLDLAFGPILVVVASTLSAGAPSWARALLAANAYAVGFALVILGRSELFTEHTTLAAFPVLSRRATVGSLARLWAIVYAANLLGAITSGVMASFVLRSIDVAQPAAFREMGHDMVDHPFWAIAASGVLAGWLMGLLSWISRTTRSTLGQLAVVWLVTAAIGFAKLHHCVAGAIEVTMAIAVPGAGVSVGDGLHFLLWATLGNIAGGLVFVALLKVGHARSPSRRE